jgi:predicted Zn finger-like uncharacterized protein
MLVRCPKCQTTYKVGDDLVKGASPAFRCSRCKHTFDLGSPGTVPSVAAPPNHEAAAAGPTVDEELRLPFDAGAHEKDRTRSAAGPLASLEDSARRLEAADEWSISPPPPAEEQQFELPASETRAASAGAASPPGDFSIEERFFPRVESKSEGDDSGNILTIANYREQRASILPFVTLFGLLVIAFSFLSILSYAKPHAAEALIKEVPLIGGSLLRNDHLKNGILLQSLQPAYQTIQGNREVFLISGVARNHNSEVVREIQLSAVSYNAEGKALERQTIWVGNTISPKIIRGMTVEDIPHLQNLKPLKSFEIPPGDSIPFTIVFLKSAKSAKEFTCEVLTAEGRV